MIKKSRHKTIPKNDPASQTIHQSRPQTKFARFVRTLLSVEKLPFYFLLSLLLLTVLECLSRRSLTEGLLFPFRSPIPWLVNYGIILMTTLLALPFRRRVAVVSLISAVWLGLGIAECVLLSFRVTPLTAVDFSILASVITIINIYLSPLQIILLTLLIAAALAAIIVLFIKVPKVKRAVGKFAAALAFSATLFTLIVVSGFQTSTLSDAFPNLANAYRDYGFAYCFSLSIFDKGIEKPKDYSEEEINQILGEIEANVSETEPDDPNVIFVQLESFFDVNLMKDITFSENPLPNFTRLKAEYESGAFRVPVVGAGTVNTEFEVLTGLSVNDFGPGEYPYKSVLKDKALESIAYDLTASGYTAHALHNHQGTFYSRHEVYKNLGFASFTPLEYMKDPEYNENQWAKDAVLTSEIFSVLDSTETRDFVFAVSVQGHGKYPTDYRPAEGEITVTGGLEDPALLSQWEYYINQLHEMDAFIGALYEEVMAYDEPVVLVFYGDHLPSLSIDSDMLTTGELYETEYLLISNYDIRLTEPIGALSAYQLFPTVMELMGNREGVINRFHQTCRGADDYNDKLRMLAYDILYGKNYTYQGSEAFLPVENMTLGTHPIHVTDAYIQGELLYVIGENFTAYSDVTLDGTDQKTIFVDENTLIVDPGIFQENFTEIRVQQKTTRGEVLSETDVYSLSKPDTAFTTQITKLPLLPDNYKSIQGVTKAA